MINYNKVIDAIINGQNVIKATEYVSPKLIVRAVRKTYGKKLPRKTDNTEIILTIGRPNYAEREFVKLCQRANEPFPVKKVQIKVYNPKPNKLKNHLIPMEFKNDRWIVKESTKSPSSNPITNE